MSTVSYRRKLLQTAFAFGALGMIVGVGIGIPTLVHFYVRRNFTGLECASFLQKTVKLADTRRHRDPIELGPEKEKLRDFLGRFKGLNYQGLHADRVLRETIPAYYSACARWSETLYDECRIDGRSTGGLKETLRCARQAWESKVGTGRLQNYATWRWNQDKPLDFSNFNADEADRITHIATAPSSAETPSERSPVHLRVLDGFECPARDAKTCGARARLAFDKWSADILPDPLKSAFRSACLHGEYFSCMVPELVTGQPDDLALTLPRRGLELLNRTCIVDRDAHSCMAMAYIPKTFSDDRQRFAHQYAYLNHACQLKLGYACTMIGVEVMSRLKQLRTSPEALPYFDMGCKLGDAGGCLGVGRNRYWSGDPKQAAIYYLKSCELGHPEACADIALLELDGKGVEISRAKARAHLRLACETYSGRGCYYLGVAHETGNGADLDPNRADELYAQGCDLGYAASCKKIGEAPEDEDGSTGSSRSIASSPSSKSENDDEELPPEYEEEEE